MSDQIDPPIDSPEDEPPVAPMPKFIPVLLGLVLVVLAALAVYTGVRRRAPLLEPSLRATRSGVPQDGGAPGEPQPGASRILHGESGENVPQAQPMLEPDPSRVAISGGPGGIENVVRLRARRGMQTLIEPGAAVVYVNGNAIGEAQQFSRTEDTYEFAEEGAYTIRISAPGYHDVVYEVTADQDAADELAILRGKMKPLR